MKNLYAVAVMAGLAFPATAHNDGDTVNPDAGRIAQLETQVKKLQGTINTLTAENQRLKAQLQLLTGNGDPAVEPCAKKRQAIEESLERLTKNGLTDNHPNIIKLKADLAIVRAECAGPAYSPPENAGCVARLADLEARRDQLIIAGFRENHPDIHALTSKINALKSECAPEGQQN